MARIALMSCVSQKQPLEEGQRIPAKDLYISALFKKSWCFAKHYGPFDKIYILSAKHGLLDPNELISTYNETLARAPVAKKKAWSAQVLQQMKAQGLDLRHDEFTILAGKNYYQYLVGGEGIQNYELIFSNKGGIGKILQFLTNATQGKECP